MAGPSPSHTDLVYGLLRAGRYDAAARALTSQLSATPRSRAALSLLAYCRYALHEYAAAAALYAQLAAHPDVSQSCDGARYALHRAACLFHAGEYSEAAAACDAASAAVEAVGAAASAAEASAAERGESPQGRFEGERPHERAGSSRGRQEEEGQERQSYCQNEEELRDVAEQLQLLRAGIAYDQEDAATARGLLPSLEAGWGRRHDEDDARETGLGGGGSAYEEGVDSVELLTAHGCIAYKEMRMDAARDLFNAAVAARGAHAYSPQLQYSLALCAYAQRASSLALRLLGGVLSSSAREHPQLRMPLGAESSAEGRSDEAASPPSAALLSALTASAVVEAVNLRAAIHWGVRDDAAAAAALRELPHRSESALDAVSLHNSAIVHMESDQAGGFRKLNHLLASPPFPRETFGNLLLLYLRYDCLDLAADTMAENAALTYRLLTPDAYDFLDASILAQTNAEDALLRFAALGARHAGAVRAAQQAAAAARSGGGAATTAAAAAAECVTAAVEAYTPVLMAHARIHWDRGHYAAAEHQLRAAAELAGDTDTWRINLAHACFMQETKHREAIRYYEPYVRAHWDDILDVTAIVLANLCVAYIMTSRNEEAEGVMRRIEAAEAAATEAAEAGPPPFHLCIVNLVVGTLYCSKGNFEFGLSRVLGALRPLSRKLGTDTWYYAKRCILATAMAVCKRMAVLPDPTLRELLIFLHEADVHGRTILAVPSRGFTGRPEDEDADLSATVVSTEARVLSKLVLLLTLG